MVCLLSNAELFNDRYGHPAGDVCLREVAAAIAAVARRPGDLPARLGGEEFALLMPATDATGAAHMAERLRAAVQDRAMPHEGSPTSDIVTASLGVVTAYPQPSLSGPGWGAAVSAADAALYAAKRAGRNRVERGEVWRMETTPA